MHPPFPFIHAIHRFFPYFFSNSLRFIISFNALPNPSRFIASSNIHPNSSLLPVVFEILDTIYHLFRYFSIPSRFITYIDIFSILRDSSLLLISFHHRRQQQEKTGKERRKRKQMGE